MSKPLPWVKYEELTNGAGRFVVSPLSRGMGITLGNSLRRVLLSALPGHAVTSLKIDGVTHEFSTIPNVVEDVFDIICNIKQLVFQSDVEEGEKKTLTIDVKKKGKVTAKDIKTDDAVKIVNTDAYIAEVAQDGKLKIEMTLEKGKGYQVQEQKLGEDQSIDTINIDASFSPVVRVNHTVEHIRVGKELDYDSLTLDVWTNGSVSPDDVVQSASALMVTKFDLFSRLNEQPEPLESEADASASDGDGGAKSALDLSVNDLELSARSSNCLKRAGINTVAELLEKDISELKQIKNFGQKSADEINDKLKQYELALKGTE